MPETQETLLAIRTELATFLEAVEEIKPSQAFEPLVKLLISLDRKIIDSKKHEHQLQQNI